jgi:hypothetical protein
MFFDDEKVILIRLDQAQVSKSLHEHADPRPRRAHHLGEFFVRDLKLDANAAGIFHPIVFGTGLIEEFVES